MSSLPELAFLAQQALLLALIVSLPAVIAGALATLFSAVFQALTQIQDSSLSQLPRLVAVVVALGIAAPWMGAQISQFAGHVFGSG